MIARSSYMKRTQISRSKGLRRAGRRVKAWSKARRELKIAFEQMGVTSCEANFEGCAGDNWLSFAHHKKRRNLEAGELKTVALLCVPCHNRVELLGEAKMKPIIEEIIARRAAA